MLLEKSQIDIDQTVTAPITACVTYVAGTAEIQVPVYVIGPDQLFAPPFLIPQGVWKVIYSLQSLGYTFDTIAYANDTNGVVIKHNCKGKQEDTWETKFDTTDVTYANKLGCTIFLSPLAYDSSCISGDPTIAVVKDPMG